MPSHNFGSSQIGLKVFGLPLEKTNMFSTGILNSLIHMCHFRFSKPLNPQKAIQLGRNSD
jgi:hypothetical protein